MDQPQHEPSHCSPGGKPRYQLTAAEQTELYETLGRKLDRIGIETQPEVAVKVLDLTKDPDAGAVDFARIMRHDPALSARVLRTANSAFFGQVGEVTSVQRACVILGLERLRTLALGFYLGRAIAGTASQELGKRIWMQSIFRGCLCASLARELAPQHTAEAFAVGLLLDVGVPLMPILLGDDYYRAIIDEPAPGELYARETHSLPFTHADVATVLMARWKLPEVLARPVAWRYVPPRPIERASTVRTLHRVAYYAGATNLAHIDSDTPQHVPNTMIAERVLNLRGGKLKDAIAHASEEYRLSIEIFGDVAGRIEDLDAIAESAHLQLIDLLERSVIDDAATHSSDLELEVEGSIVRLNRAEDGTLVALLIGADGEAIVRHRFVPAHETPLSLMRSLGFDRCPPQAEHTLREYLRVAA